MTILVSPVRAIVAADVMTTPPVSIAPSTTVWAAWSLMMRTGLHHLVVAVDDTCLGVIDDRTVFAEWPMGPLALRRRTVRELIRPATTCVLPDTDLQLVARVMLEDGTDSVPVVSSDGRLVGIVTRSDIARVVAVEGVHHEEK